MKVAAQIREKIKEIPESEPFGYAQLGISPGNFFTAAKALERLQKKGVIKKVSKGIFFKPQKTIFGELEPNYDLLLKNYLFKDGERVGYVTGYTLYNELNLTTQMSFNTQVATKRGRKKIEIGWLKANIVKAYVDVTEENYRLLGVLDALKDIKKIPGTTADKALQILMPQMKELALEDIDSMMQYALQYPPRVRALLGALIESIFPDKFDLKALKQSLNPYSTYKLNIKTSTLPATSKWNII
ncbi:MAG: hypothetical protein KDC85_06140 [Saprospiraceae bacterium]|nr:hypothetical protein [Saprospiraceae bacterium]MCB9323952.1 hypothetical protein [Lewinellaceae bacterium]